MPKGDYLGEFEQIVLLALHRLGDDAYGMTVRRHIEERTGREVTIGAVYATLDRLERKGFVGTTMADPTPERGGRAKRFYRLEAAGVDALQRSRDLLDRMWEDVRLESGG